jgi:hypothetical protein
LHHEEKSKTVPKKTKAEMKTIINATFSREAQLKNQKISSWPADPRERKQRIIPLDKLY